MRGRPSFLSREKCFYLWMELGSVRKVCNYLEKEGITNPTTNKPPSNAGVRIAAYKFALHNPEKARMEYVRRFGLFGIGQEDVWCKYLTRKATAFLTTNVDRYRNWEKSFEKYKKSVQNQ